MSAAPLHLVCMGEPTVGQPTVLLEAGVGGWSSRWHAGCQPEVARFARVCAYDRAGYGWSEAGPRPRDGQRIVAELRTRCWNARASVGPTCWWGRAGGGQYVRLYHAAYPAEVAGLVLVDAEPEEFRAPNRRMPAPPRRKNR